MSLIGCCSSKMTKNIDKSNTHNETDSSKNCINISIVSTNSKAGKSMLIHLLKQTGFIQSMKLFSNEEYTFVNNKLVILRRISSRKDAKQWIIKGNIVLFAVRGASTPNDHITDYLQHASEKKTLFIIRTHFTEQQTIQNERELIWSQYGQFLTCEKDIYLIGNGFNHRNKWDFERLTKDLKSKCRIIQEEQIDQSILEADVVDHVKVHNNELSSIDQKSSKPINEMSFDKEKQSFIEYFNKHGLDEIEQYFISRLREWEQISLDIAVTGNSGAGKSSFINAIRGVKHNSTDAAPVGVVECTSDLTAYPHPIHQNLTFWDLPDCGTIKYPCETYLKDMNFERFDVVIIICNGRFTENDSWLADEVTKIRKSFFFLRSKIDQDIRNAKDDCPPPFDENAELNKIYNDCLQNLTQYSNNRKVYLVSSHPKWLHQWDMNGFMCDLCQSCPQLKRESLVFSINAHCREAVQLKVEYLRKRQWLVCSAIAAAAILPIPGLSMNINLLACLTEAKEYRQQLGLHNEAVQRLITLRDTLSEYNRRTIDSILPLLDDKTFEELFKSLLITPGAALGHCIPFIGSLRSIQTVTELLDYFLKMMGKVALIVIDIHFGDIPSSLPVTTTDNSDFILQPIS